MRPISPLRCLSIVLLGTICAASACTTRGAPAPTPAEAKAFVDEVNATLLKLDIAAAQAGWVAQTYITADTQAMSARASQVITDAIAKYAKASTRFDGLVLPADVGAR